jgi:Lrp/AsnC family transcriptional regulator for asnA, asnC and gidA
LSSIAKKIGVYDTTVKSCLNRPVAEENIQIVAASNPMKLGFEIIGVLRIEVDILNPEVY